MIRKLFHNAHVTTPCDLGAPLSGTHQGDVQSFEKGALLCKNGRIEAIGNEKEVIAVAASVEVDIEIDCERRCMIPGFVDPHTHMCFAKSREQEFNQRIEGQSYLEILYGGGGILSSVRAVRDCAEEELFSVTRSNALSALRLGTTTLEIKSGYGLQTETRAQDAAGDRKGWPGNPAGRGPDIYGCACYPWKNTRNRPTNTSNCLSGK